jgi:cytidine deaminase
MSAPQRAARAAQTVKVKGTAARVPGAKPSFFRREGLRGDHARLARAAARARRRAYAPYSQFPVGAAVLTTDGMIYTGCNVENASYGLTLCAERVAIHTAVANGRRRVTALAVAGPAGVTLMPCGACRQVMDEFGVRTVILASARRAPAIVSLSDLLPWPFTRRSKRTRHAGL